MGYRWSGNDEAEQKQGFLREVVTLRSFESGEAESEQGVLKGVVKGRGSWQSVPSLKVGPSSMVAVRDMMETALIDVECNAAARGKNV